MFLKEKSKGFTLIELLVVISIIALLLSILMPGLQKAKEHARVLVCKTNLKQISFASLLWAEDHDGWTLASGWSWGSVVDGYDMPTSLEPYLEAARGDAGTANEDLKRGGIYSCPTATKIEFPVWVSADGTEYQNNKKMAYGINGWIAANCGDSPGSKGVGDIFGDASNNYWADHGVTKLSNIRSPSRIIYFMDCSYYGLYPWNFDPFTPVEDLIAPTATRWHGKKDEFGYGFGNVAMVDGSVGKEPDNVGLRPQARERPSWERYFYKAR